MMQIKYASLAVLAVAVLPTQSLGKPIVCDPPHPSVCIVEGCVLIDDRWHVTVEPSGQIYLEDRKISRRELKKDAAAWAETGTWPIVVSGRPGTKYAQVTSIVEMLRKTGVWTKVSCVAPQA